jgi:hypothetical protein
LKPSITPDSFRTAAVAAARRNGVALVLSINLMGMAVVGDCERRSTGKECYMTRCGHARPIAVPSRTWLRW